MKQFYNQTTQKLSILIILTIFSIIPITLVCAAMSSDNYKINADSINVGGSQSNSASYKMEDTVGEMGTGESASGSYIMEAGYQAMVGAAADPTLSFNVTDAIVALGALSASGVQTDTATMTAATNATGGYSITVFGSTLTSGSDTIEEIGADAEVSATGTEQFGMKISKSGNEGVAVAPYNHDTNYAYFGVSSADECANSASGPSETTTFTMEYMANITTTTEAGSYSAIHTYICTGTF